MLEKIQTSKQGKFTHYLLHNQAVRVLFFQFISTTFLLFMATSVGTLPPFYTPEYDHLKDPNPFRLVFVVIIVYSIICFSGPFTGAHINPAVTLVAYLEKKKNKGQFAVISAYLVAQLSGAFLGTILSRQIYGNGGPIFKQMPEAFEMLKLSFQQFVATFIFIFVLLIITTNETTFVTDQAWTHLSIAMVYYLCLTLASTFHFINPAVVVAVQAQAMISGDVDSSGILPCLALIILQFLGAGLAEILFRKFYVPVYKTWKQSLY